MAHRSGTIVRHCNYPLTMTIRQHCGAAATWRTRSLALLVLGVLSFLCCCGNLVRAVCTHSASHFPTVRGPRHGSSFVAALGTASRRGAREMVLGSEVLRVSQKRSTVYLSRRHEMLGLGLIQCPPLIAFYGDRVEQRRRQVPCRWFRSLRPVSSN